MKLITKPSQVIDHVATGQALKAERKRLRLTATAVCKEAKLNPTLFCLMEKGERPWTEARFNIVAAVLKKLGKIEPGSVTTELPNGTTKHLGDEVHQLHTAQHAQEDSLPAEVHEGKPRDALRHTLGRVPRMTNAERRRLANLALAEHPEYSNGLLGKMYGLAANTIANYRRSQPEAARPVKRLGADGKKRKVKAK